MQSSIRQAGVPRVMCDSHLGLLQRDTKMRMSKQQMIQTRAWQHLQPDQTDLQQTCFMSFLRENYEPQSHDFQKGTELLSMPS